MPLACRGLLDRARLRVVHGQRLLHHHRDLARRARFHHHRVIAGAGERGHRLRLHAVQHRPQVLKQNLRREPVGSSRSSPSTPHPDRRRRRSPRPCALWQLLRNPETCPCTRPAMARRTGFASGVCAPSTTATGKKSDQRSNHACMISRCHTSLRPVRSPGLLTHAHLHDLAIGAAGDIELARRSNPAPDW